MRIGIIGASGFVGRHLAGVLRRRGDEVFTASLRNPLEAAAVLDRCDVIVNLAGEPLAQRWTPRVKKEIERSRVDAPRRFLDALSERTSHSVKAYVSASAIGYYGTSETATFDEGSERGHDFLADVCVKWEREAARAERLGVRVAIVRSGIALGTDGGALKAMLPPFKAGIGGIVGNGRQWFSWIHIDDLVGIYLLAIDGSSGILNGTAPQPVSNGAFTRALGHALHRPTLLPVPTLALRAMLGEGADMLLHGQRVLPERTLTLGYHFAYPQLETALTALLNVSPH